MHFNIYKEARLSLIILSIVLAISLLFCFFASMFTSMGYKGLRTVTESYAVSFKDLPVIIIDAGHGGEDPGAVDNGLIEKDLNLEIANLINTYMALNGFKTAMTRTDDRLLYNAGEEKQKKHFDIRNRKSFAENFENAVFVSIHMNKFPAEYCKGAQTFYTKLNEKSAVLAENIQNALKLIQSDNKRSTANSGDSIYLLSNLKMPSVLVECGFISNNNEANEFRNSNYKASIALSIYFGIIKYLEI